MRPPQRTIRVDMRMLNGPNGATQGPKTGEIRGGACVRQAAAKVAAKRRFWHALLAFKVGGPRTLPGLLPCCRPTLFSVDSRGSIP